MNTKQLTQLEAQREQRFFNGIVESAEFWANVEDMTMEKITDFLKHQIKNIKKRNPVTLKKIGMNAKELQEYEGILAILEVEN
jgi:hypothetical protein